MTSVSGNGILRRNRALEELLRLAREKELLTAPDDTFGRLPDEDSSEDGA